MDKYPKTTNNAGEPNTPGMKLKSPGWMKRLPKGIKRILVSGYWLYSDFVDFVVEFIGHIPSHLFRIMAYRLIGIEIGYKTSIHRYCRFYNPKNVKIGNNSVVNRDVLLDGRMGIVIGNNVSISEGTLLITLEHDPNSLDFATRGGQIVIHDYVFLGSRSIILPGVTIEQGAVVAAGAVVTKDVPAKDIVAGVPARQIGKRTNDLSYQIDYHKFLG